MFTQFHFLMMCVYAGCLLERFVKFLMFEFLIEGWRIVCLDNVSDV